MTTNHQPKGLQMTISFPGESAEYRSARNELLNREVDLRRAMEAVARVRRALPRGGLVAHDYPFEDLDDGGRPKEVRLSELFAEGRDSLVIYNMMFPRNPADTRPGAASGATSRLALRDAPCPSCTALVDQLDGAAPHAEQRVNLVVVGKAPITRIRTFAHERGWTGVRLVSSASNSFNRDYLGETDGARQRPMLNVFHRTRDGIRHFWGSEMLYEPSEPGEESRHVGTLEPLWNLFDLTPEGRPSDWDEQLTYCCAPISSGTP